MELNMHTKYITVLSLFIIVSLFYGDEYKPRYTKTKEGDLEYAVGVIKKSRGNVHDAFVTVLEIGGNEEMIPLLISRLRDMGDIDKNSFVCTRGHCISLLFKISGIKSENEMWGINSSDWVLWYEQKYKTKFIYIPIESANANSPSNQSLKGRM
jgi:hypothetical protein